MWILFLFLRDSRKTSKTKILKISGCSREACSLTQSGVEDCITIDESSARPQNKLHLKLKDLGGFTLSILIESFCSINSFSLT